MIVVIARDYQHFIKWLEEEICYVGDADDLARINPSEVSEIKFVGENYCDHPIYFSDYLLKFQMAVSKLRKRG